MKTSSYYLSLFAAIAAGIVLCAVTQFIVMAAGVPVTGLDIMNSGLGFGAMSGCVAMIFGVPSRKSSPGFFCLSGVGGGVFAYALSVVFSNVPFSISALVITAVVAAVVGYAQYHGALLAERNIS